MSIVPLNANAGFNADQDQIDEAVIDLNVPMRL